MHVPAIIQLRISVNRDVYDKLVENGTIVPEPEQPPPTVPMDYTWARVGYM